VGKLEEAARTEPTANGTKRMEGNIMGVGERDDNCGTSQSISILKLYSDGCEEGDIQI
jgi:isopropylmalate/homocitrate/citramalate synthase